jgi:hypothetical protein
VSIPFKPGRLPKEFDPRATEKLFADLLRAVGDDGLKYLLLQALVSEPDRMISNMFALADGTNWNPGSGAGLYRRNAANSAWLKMAESTDLAGYQPLDADLTLLAGITVAANQFLARSSAGAIAAKTITDFGLSLVDDANNTTARTTLGLGTAAVENVASMPATTFASTVTAAAIGPTSARQHTLPNQPSDTLALLGLAQTWTAVNTYSAQPRFGAGSSSGGVTYYYAPALTTKAAPATLTAAEVLTQEIRYTGVAGTLTLPLATDLETAITPALQNDRGFLLTFINTSANLLTIAVNTGITAVGTLTVPTATSGVFQLRHSASNTFVLTRH